jgi:hypothetical protein
MENLSETAPKIIALTDKPLILTQVPVQDLDLQQGDTVVIIP